MAKETARDRKFAPAPEAEPAPPTTGGAFQRLPDGSLVPIPADKPTSAPTDDTPPAPSAGSSNT